MMIDKRILECMRAQVSAGLESNLSPDNAKQVLDYIEHVHGTVIDLLAEKDKLQKDLKQTQYLSVLWVRILDSYIPPEKKREAMKACAAAIAEGMKQAGIEEFDVHLEQLEEQANSE
jgi:hypothetical protein